MSEQHITLFAIARRYGKIMSVDYCNNGSVIVAVEGGILVCYENDASRITVDFTKTDSEIRIAI